MLQNEAFWLLVAFVVFFGLLGKTLMRFITGALDNRANRIQQELDEAVKLREEAQALLVSFQRKQRDAIKEAETIVAEAKSQAETMLREAEEELEKALNKRIELAMEKISQAEADVVQDVKNNAVDIAVAASHALLQEHMAKSEGTSQFKEALKEIKNKLH